MKPALSRLLLFMIACALFACKKDKTDPPPNTVLKKVKQVTWGPEDFARYEYNAAGHVVKHISQWKNGAGTVQRLTNEYSFNAAGAAYPLAERSRLCKFYLQKQPTRTVGAFCNKWQKNIQHGLYLSKQPPGYRG